MKSIIQFPSKLLTPIREYLQHEQMKLMKSKSELKREDPFTDSQRVDDNADIGKEAAEQFGHQRSEALRSEVDKILINIRKTLTKIKIGKYGLCEKCGKLIDTDRLAINPTAEFCMDCQKKSVATVRHPATKMKPKKPSGRKL
ncbi:TraR/DksA C4-type zinc finger protein [Candidatus Collierbacteria bacterium]|nr:TraR/DksA C4-type zinc finger protein [Candidatus Collierbacteria bacterium]